MTTIKELKRNYDGVYRMWHGVPILVTWEKSKPEALCPQCNHTVHTRECVFNEER